VVVEEIMSKGCFSEREVKSESSSCKRSSLALLLSEMEFDEPCCRLLSDGVLVREGVCLLGGFLKDRAGEGCCLCRSFGEGGSTVSRLPLRDSRAEEGESKEAR